jgi:hypothetical protein
MVVVVISVLVNISGGSIISELHHLLPFVSEQGHHIIMEILLRFPPNETIRSIFVLRIMQEIEERGMVSIDSIRPILFYLLQTLHPYGNPEPLVSPSMQLILPHMPEP